MLIILNLDEGNLQTTGIVDRKIILFSMKLSNSSTVIIGRICWGVFYGWLCTITLCDERFIRACVLLRLCHAFAKMKEVLTHLKRMCAIFFFWIYICWLTIMMCTCLIVCFSHTIYYLVLVYYNLVLVYYYLVLVLVYLLFFITVQRPVF